MDVYRVTNRVTGKCYIGSTIRTAERRFREHCGNAVRGERIAPLYDAMRDHGVSAFEVETIATSILYEELLELERQAIAAHDCVVPKGYNVVKGGRGNFGWRMSEKTRQKIAARARGRKAHNKGMHPSREACEHISVAQRLRFQRECEQGKIRVAWNKGIPHTEEARKKMSAKHAGIPMTEAQYRACKARRATPETRAKMAQARRDWWAKHSIKFSRII